VLAHSTNLRGAADRSEGTAASALARPLRIERRTEARRENAATPTHLWVLCKGGEMGGQVKVRDGSRGGLGVVVDRAASRFVAALRAAKGEGAAVDVCQSLHGEYEQARIVWDLEGESREIRFGLELSAPPSTRR
jgi:hypothetical protein